MILSLIHISSDSDDGDVPNPGNYYDASQIATSADGKYALVSGVTPDTIIPVSAFFICAIVACVFVPHILKILFLLFSLYNLSLIHI